jgi:outer membrane protein assembly factor BamB
MVMTVPPRVASLRTPFWPHRIVIRHTLRTPKERNMKTFTVSFCVVMITMLLVGCGPKQGAYYLKNEVVPAQIEDRAHLLPDSGATVREVHVSMDPAPGMVVDEYDEHFGRLLLRQPGTSIARFLVYDIPQRTLRSLAKSDMTVSVLSCNNLILKDPVGNHLYDFPSGAFVRDAEGALFIMSDGKALILSTQEFGSIDVRTGKRGWTIPSEGWEGFRQQVVLDSICYVIADGLFALHPEKGKRWELITSTHFTNVGKEMALQCLTSCLAAAAGGYNTRSYKPEVTHNMNSLPLFDGEVIYFAARDNVFALEKTTGRVIWQVQVDPEPDRMNLYNISATEIAEVSLGSKLLDFRMLESAPPSVRIINKKDGTTRVYFALEENKVTQDFRSTDSTLLLMTQSQLYHMNRDLKTLGISETSAEYGALLDIVYAKDTIVVRTANGLLGISAKDYSSVWFVRCPVPYPESITDAWRVALSQKITVLEESFYTRGLYWTMDGAHGLAGIDIHKGKKMVGIPLAGKDHHRYAWDNYFVSCGDKEFSILQFAPPESVKETKP